MADVIKQIRSAGGDYATAILWEADLDDDPIYDAGDVAIGDCYADTTFSAATEVLINGGTTIGLAGRILRAASGERPEGLAGGGVVFQLSGDVTGNWLDLVGSITTQIQWIEWDGNDFGSTASQLLNCDNGSNSKYSFEHLLVHDITQPNDSGLTAINGPVRDYRAIRNIFYNFVITGTSNRDLIVLRNDADQVNSEEQNNTIFNADNQNTNAGSNADGFLQFTDDVDYKCQNNIVVTVVAAGGAAVCFNWPGTTNLTGTNNLSSDATADDPAQGGDLINKSASDQFVSTTGGSENLHLKSGADAIGAGVDLGTDPTGVEIDIDELDVDAAAVTWDMGADQFVAAAPVALATWHPFQADLAPPVHDMVPSGFIPPQRPES